jgi:hypothetical protein
MEEAELSRYAPGWTEENHEKPELGTSPVERYGVCSIDISAHRLTSPLNHENREADIDTECYGKFIKAVTVFVFKFRSQITSTMYFSPAVSLVDVSVPVSAQLNLPAAQEAISSL